MVIYIIHFEVPKKKFGIALGFLSIDLIQKERAVGKSIMEQYVIKWIFYPNSHALYHLDLFIYLFIWESTSFRLISTDPKIFINFIIKLTMIRLCIMPIINKSNGQKFS